MNVVKLFPVRKIQSSSSFTVEIEVNIRVVGRSLETGLMKRGEERKKNSVSFLANYHLV